MAVEELTHLPSAFTAGSTVKVRSSSADFPADTWVLEYSFRGPTPFKKTAVLDAAAWLLTLSSEDTKAIRPGTYLWATRATNPATGETQMIGRGNVGISANPFADTVKSAQRIIVENLEKIVGQLAGKTSQSATLNGKSYTIQNLPELYKMLRQARQDLAAEENADAMLAGQRSRNDIHIAFTNPGYPTYSTEFPLYPGFKPVQ